MNQSNIRAECLQPAGSSWQQPSGEEIREALRLAGFTGKVAAARLGLGTKGDRTVRRWVSEDSEIPYACWSLLCNFAGFGCIWRND